jgi:hypothetical protein
MASIENLLPGFISNFFDTLGMHCPRSCRQPFSSP